MTNQPSGDDQALASADKQPAAEAGSDSPQAYRVLARKYRPAKFADLIGQEATVRTLSNAITSGRVAHAFILTGVRGVGKTTTARILARALNCIGPEGTGGPTPEPCGVCEHCLAIGQDRHVDVIEMDAASRTGIDDIRELIEGVRYRPVTARNKIYIIDEVHMLSRQAFNGLLKTLEEPPENVVFIFATTEIRKLPVTVLSRCQRFDLRRVEEAQLGEHFGKVAEQEQVSVTPEALAMIARAADGSVRDGLSLLDQAIALTATGQAPLTVSEEQVKDMLGLADRARSFDLLEAILKGAVGEALDILGDLHGAGADPVVVLQDLLELTHFLTRVKLVPEIADDPATPETERRRGRALAETLSMPVLARAWQMLLKGLGETRSAPRPLQAAEMVVIRLAYAAELPSPADLVKRLQSGDGALAPTGVGPNRSAGPDLGAPATAQSSPAQLPPAQSSSAQSSSAQSSSAQSSPVGSPQAQLAAVPDLEASAEVQPQPQPQNFPEVIALARQMGEQIFANHLAAHVRLVHFEAGRIEVRPEPQAPANLVNRLSRLLEDWTGRRWMVSVSSESGAQPQRARERDAQAQLYEEARSDPLVEAVLESFPEAKLVSVRARPPSDPDGSAASADGPVETTEGDEAS